MCTAILASWKQTKRERWATLRRYRTAIAGLVERHDGRIVNTWGDAVIAEFASVVEAVQCAVEIQQEISNQDSDPPHAHRMRFRIGINLGDVMVDGSDIYGDGVNIAARLQELAEPGGIVVSASVYDQVHNKLSVGFDCLGQQQMKNVAPVTSYRVTMGGRAVGRHGFPVDEGPAPQLERLQPRKLALNGFATDTSHPRGCAPSRIGWRTCLAPLQRPSQFRAF